MPVNQPARPDRHPARNPQISGTDLVAQTRVDCEPSNIQSASKQPEHVPALRRFGLTLFLFTLAAAYLRDHLNQFPIPSPEARLVLSQPDTALLMPIRSLRVRQIADTWHAPRDHRRKHEGQDIFAPKGTPIYSATNGIVLRIGQAGIGGNAVSVLGAGGRVYYYAHMSRFAENVRIGQAVTPDTVLGYVGNTGNARTTPSHLHFGVYGPDGAINPLPLLTNRDLNLPTRPASRYTIGLGPAPQG